MAWDFETEPAFEEQLAWMRSFIDRELIPLEPIFDEVPAEEWQVVKRHLQGQVKARGLWGAFLDPNSAATASASCKLALMSEIIGRCMMSMTIFGVQAPTAATWSCWRTAPPMRRRNAGSGQICGVTSPVRSRSPSRSSPGPTRR